MNIVSSGILLIGAIILQYHGTYTMLSVHGWVCCGEWLHLSLPNGLSTSGVPPGTLYTFLFPTMCELKHTCYILRKFCPLHNSVQYIIHLSRKYCNINLDTATVRKIKLSLCMKAHNSGGTDPLNLNLSTTWHMPWPLCASGILSTPYCPSSKLAYLPTGFWHYNNSEES